MKKFLSVLIVVFALYGCSAPRPADGTYFGIITENGNTTETTLTLSNGTFALQRTPLSDASAVEAFTGNLVYEKKGVVRLESTDKVFYFKLAENNLIMLDEQAQAVNKGRLVRL